jgi:hypothetical protein
MNKEGSSAATTVVGPPSTAARADASPEHSSSVSVSLFAVLSVVLLGLTWWKGSQLKATVHGDLRRLIIFPHLFVRYDLPLVPLFAVLLVAAAGIAFAAPPRWLGSRTRWGGFAQWITDHPWLFAAFAFAVLAAASLFVYDNYPLSLDEYAQYFQAQIFATGHLHGQYPAPIVRGLLPLPGEFILFSPKSGETMTGYWPGLPLLITPFMWLGIPWAANPVLGAAGILLMRKLCLRLMPETPHAAGWAMLFMLASPAFFVNAISYYSMNANLVSGLAFAVLVLDPTPRRLVAAGVLGSVALVLHNPVPHTLFALPWIVWLAMGAGRVRRLGWLALGYFPLTLILGLGWWWLKSRLAVDLIAATTHETASTAHAALVLVSNGAWKWPDKSVLVNRAIAILKLNLWAVPGLLVASLFGFHRLRRQPGARLMAMSALLTLVVFLFVKYDQGHGWGNRYFHSAWGPDAAVSSQRRRVHT